MPGWTFITNHAVVLSLIAKNPSLTALELATLVGITERAVRRVIADLSADGYISKQRIGRGVRYSISPDQTLRHETHQEIAIGDFLEALGWKR
jgi:DNA-binding MarR family transcriptional regulator